MNEIREWEPMEISDGLGTIVNCAEGVIGLRPDESDLIVAIFDQQDHQWLSYIGLHTDKVVLSEVRSCFRK